MFTSDKWETISEIAERRKVKFREAAEGVKKEFRSGEAICRFTNEDGYGQLLEFRRQK